MSSLREYSPLRYPGGKACLTHFITDLAEMNDRLGSTYVELYAGGAVAPLNLLFRGVFGKIHINDFDFSIYSVWRCILEDTEDFLRLINDTPVTLSEWKKQRDIYKQGKGAGSLALGFATFFLNRTNRSGIIFKAGPIGGLEQNGNYLIDVRFNKKNLAQRIEKIAGEKSRILLTNNDAVEMLHSLEDYHTNTDKIFLYLDPPYYQKGKALFE